MAKSPRTELERRALRAMLAAAFFRPESALTIALVILLSFFMPHPFPGWQWWFWPIGGALAEAAILYTSLTDPEFGRRVVADMLRQTFDLKQVRDKRYRAYLEKALEYRERIEMVTRQRRKGALRTHLQETARQVDNWLQGIYEIARRLDRYAQDDIIQRDKRTVPARIKKLRQDLKRERNPRVREQLEETLRAKERQWANLEQLENSMERAELQLEHTLTAMGTIYSQLLLVGAKDVDSGRAQRLREEVAQQVLGLQDVLDSMDAVYETSAQF